TSYQKKRNRLVGTHSINRLIRDLQNCHQFTNGQGVGYALDSISNAGCRSCLSRRFLNALPEHFPVFALLANSGIAAQAHFPLVNFCSAVLPLLFSSSSP